jgi:hypothetical protein
MLGFLAAVTYAGWSPKRIIDEIRLLVEKLQKQLIEMRLFTSVSCYKAACQYAKSVEGIVRRSCLAYDSSGQADVNTEDLDGLRAAQSLGESGQHNAAVGRFHTLHRQAHDHHGPDHPHTVYAAATSPAGA